MITSIKVKIIDDPNPPFAGTTMKVTATDELKTFGISYLELCAGSAAITIDWGDGSVERVTAEGEVLHEYAASGEYTVTLSDDVSALYFSGMEKPAYNVMLTEIVTKSLRMTLDQYCFNRCENLVKADIAALAITTIPVSCFKFCYALKELVLPDGITALDKACFAQCTALETISLPLVDTIKGSSSTSPFYKCSGLKTIHFAASNEAAIKASSAYKYSPTLGAENAEVVFDL